MDGMTGVWKGDLAARLGLVESLPLKEQTRVGSLGDPAVLTEPMRRGSLGGSVLASAGVSLSLLTPVRVGLII